MTACDRCGEERHPANLTQVGAALVCPACLYARAARQIARPKLPSRAKTRRRGVVPAEPPQTQYGRGVEVVGWIE